MTKQKVQKKAKLLPEKDETFMVIGRNLELERSSRSQSELVTKMVSADTFKQELLKITSRLGSAVNEVNATLNQYMLKEIEIKLELSVNGTLGILGTGVSSTGTGGISLKFIRETPGSDVQK